MAFPQILAVRTETVKKIWGYGGTEKVRQKTANSDNKSANSANKQKNPQTKCPILKPTAKSAPTRQNQKNKNGRISTNNTKPAKNK